MTLPAATTSAVFSANDKTIEEYRELATTSVGIENVDWRCEWCDGGRAKFIFNDSNQLSIFQTFRRLLAT